MMRRLFRLRRSRRRPVVAGALAGLLFVYLIALSPHLVHHAFDEDHGRSDCPYFTQGQQTPGIPVEPPSFTPPVASDVLPARRAPAVRASSVLTSSEPRAPPASTPSA